MSTSSLGFQRIKVIAWSVTDLARAERFYSNTLGLPPAYEGDERVGYMLGTTILMLKENWYAPPTQQPNPRITIATNDARQTEQALRERSVVISDPVQLYDEFYVGSFLDSEGNKLWFCSEEGAAFESSFPSFMPCNIEIKARLADPDRTRVLAEQLSDTPVEVLRQHDTFFTCVTGRLKLRELSSGEGQLIFYRRANVASTKQSDYLIAATTDPSGLRSVLSEAWGTLQTVTKTRLLYFVGQTRIHLDDVAGLGFFLELEVVLHEGQQPAEGHRIARELMTRLEIQDADLIDGAYADLLTAVGVAHSAKEP